MSGFRAAFIALCLLLVAPAGRAVDSYLVAGASVTLGGRFAASAAWGVVGSPMRWGSWQWQPVAGLTVINRRADRRDHLDRRVAVGSAGFRLTQDSRPVFFSFQLGAAAGRTDAISSATEFVSTLGWRGQRVVWMLRHISNGDLANGRNLGETMLMVGVHY